MIEQTSITKEIQSFIEKLLTDSPGLIRREITPLIATTLGVTLNQVGWNVAKMVAHGDLVVDRTIPRKHRYFLNTDQVVQRIVRVGPGSRRLFVGPVRSPIEWCVSQLQGIAA